MAGSNGPPYSFLRGFFGGSAFDADTVGYENELYELIEEGGGGNATELQGVPISATPPTNGQVLTYNSTDDEYIPETPSGGGAVSSVFGRTGAVVADTGDYTVAQVTGAAPLASPALTGSPTAPTKTALTNNTDLATTAYADSAVSAETTRAEGAESTNATAISTETSRAETAEALLAPKASPALTGTPTAPTAAALTDDTQIATTAYADSAVGVETSRAETAEALLAPLASPALTGTPTAPTQTAGDNSTKLATDAFVTTAVANAVAGVNPAVAVQAATTAAANTSGFIFAGAGVGATMTGSVNTAVTIDGYTFTAVGQRLLVKNDTQSPSGAHDGIYVLTVLQTVGVAPVFTRATDYDTPSDINNTGAIPVVNGTANAQTTWVQTAQVVTVDTTPMTWVEFSLAPGALMAVATYDPAGIDQQVVGTTATQTLTNKTLTAPVISSMVSGGDTVTVPAATDTLVGRATTDTLTNKRITKRVSTTNAPGATPSMNTDNYDVFVFTGLAANITSMTTNLTGTPSNDGDLVLIKLTDNGTSRTITWGASFEASTVALPAATTISTLLTVLFQWNTVTSAWRCIGVA